MNNSKPIAVQQVSRNFLGTGKVYVPLMMLAALALFAIDGQSLWNDELATVKIAAPAWSKWLESFVSWPDSDSQVPLYNLYMKAWTGIAPLKEYWIRLSNLPWLGLALFSLWYAPVNSANRQLARILTVVVFIHPLTWYYSNEARQYAMLLAGSAMALSGLLGLMQFDTAVGDEQRGITFLVLGATLMTLTSLTGVLWAVAFIGPGVLLCWRRHGWMLGVNRGNLYTVAACIVLLIAPIAIYYKYTIDRGVPAADIGNKLANYIYALYELVGLSGLGPGRTELRAAEAGARASAALLPYLPTLALAGLAVVAILAVGVSQWKRINWLEFATMLVFFAIPLAVFIAMASLKNFRVVGRHLLPLVLLYCTIVAVGIDSLISRKRASPPRHQSFRVGVVVVFSALMIGSSTSIALAARHERDDLRRAAKVALSAVEAGHTVWWGVDTRGAWFYGVPITSSGEGCFGSNAAGARVVDVNYANVEQLQQCSDPGVVVVSSRSRFYGQAAQFMTARHYRVEESWAGFVVLRPETTESR